MLSDDAIEKLALPIARRQENINNYIIGLIAERIKRIGTVNASDVAKLQQLMYIGGDMDSVQKALAQASKMNEKELKSILYSAAEEMYGDAKGFYEFRGLPFVPLDKNPNLISLVDAISKETADSLANLSNTTGFTVRRGGVRMPMTIRNAYTSAVDEAIQAIKANVADYNSAMRRTMRQLINSGVRTFGYNANPQSEYFGRTYVTYSPKSGRHYTRRLDSAVKINVLDGVKALNQRMQDAIGEQVGADGKEISVHRYPAADHAPVQGHVFSNEEYEKLQTESLSHDVNGNIYPPMKRAIGMWNCRHFAFSVIIRVYPPNYSQEQLDKILAENERGYTHEGKHYTMYQCTQLQRQYETEIRQAKDGYIAAERLGDDKLADEYHSRVNKLMNEYSVFSESCGLKVDLNNIYVNGYKPRK